MTWEEFLPMLIGAVFAVASSILAYNAKGIITQLKELSVTASSLQLALNESTSQTKQLVEQVKRLDKENATLRRAHDTLTRFLISKGILTAPEPNLNDL